MKKFKNWIALFSLMQLLFQNNAIGQTGDEFINKQLISTERTKVIKPFPHLENYTQQNLKEKLLFYSNRVLNEDVVYIRMFEGFYSEDSFQDASKIYDSDPVFKFSFIELTPIFDFSNCFNRQFLNTFKSVNENPNSAIRNAFLDHTINLLNSCVDLRNSHQSVQIDYQTGKVNFKDAVLLFKKNVAAHESRVRMLKVKVNETGEDLKAGRPNRHARSNNFREAAKSDVVAQVLNYASGLKEDASGNIFFYPVNTENGRCEYKLYTDQGTVEGDIASQYAQAGKFLSQLGIPGVSEAAAGLVDVVDLNKGNLQNINFYKLQGAQRNKFTGLTAYLRYQSRVEGLPDMFECDSNSCNIDRLKRGWSLVASKCKGVTKAF